MISLEGINATKAKQALKNASKSGLKMLKANFTSEYGYCTVLSGENVYTVVITKNDTTDEVEGFCNHTHTLALPEKGESQLCKHIAFVASQYREWFIEQDKAATVAAPVVEVEEFFCGCGAVIQPGLKGDKCIDCLNSELFG
jgi:hypothetical protein